MYKFGKIHDEEGKFQHGDKLTYKDAGVGDTKEGGRAVELMKDQ